jgi:hypothetical protein
MNTLVIQRLYYISGYACLLALPYFVSINSLVVRLHVPIAWSIINLQRHSNRESVEKRVFQDFRVDIWSCEHRYDPTRFINLCVHFFRGWSTFAHYIVIQAFTDCECSARKGEMIGYR